MDFTINENISIKDFLNSIFTNSFLDNNPEVLSQVVRDNRDILTDGLTTNLKGSVVNIREELVDNIIESVRPPKKLSDGVGEEINNITNIKSNLSLNYPEGYSIDTNVIDIPDSVLSLTFSTTPTDPIFDSVSKEVSDKNIILEVNNQIIPEDNGTASVILSNTDNSVSDTQNVEVKNQELKISNKKDELHPEGILFTRCQGNTYEFFGGTTPIKITNPSVLDFGHDGLTYNMRNRSVLLEPVDNVINNQHSLFLAYAGDLEVDLFPYYKVKLNENEVKIIKFYENIETNSMSPEQGLEVVWPYYKRESALLNLIEPQHEFTPGGDGMKINTGLQFNDPLNFYIEGTFQGNTGGDLTITNPDNKYPVGTITSEGDFAFVVNFSDRFGEFVMNYSDEGQITNLKISREFTTFSDRIEEEFSFNLTDNKVESYNQNNFYLLVLEENIIPFYNSIPLRFCKKTIKDQGNVLETETLFNNFPTIHNYNITSGEVIISKSNANLDHIAILGSELGRDDLIDIIKQNYTLQ